MTKHISRLKIKCVSDVEKRNIKEKKRKEKKSLRKKKKNIQLEWNYDGTRFSLCNEIVIGIS